MIDRLKAAGVEAELLTLEAPATASRQGCRAAEKAMLAFFDKHLKKAQVNTGTVTAPEKKDDKADDEKMRLNKALKMAASLGRWRWSRICSRGPTFDDVVPQRKTPLVRAILGDRFEVVKVLLENGADINYPDGSGRYPVYFCCTSTNVEMLKYLLGKGGGKDINRGPFPMLVSLCDHGQGSAEMIPIIIKAGASPDDSRVR